MVATFRRRRALLAAVLAASACLLAAAPGRATIQRHFVDIRLAGPPRAAEAGKPFEAVLEIEAAADVDLEDLLLRTGGPWRLSGAGLPEALHLTKGETRRIPITATTDDPAAPLAVEYRLGGETVTRAIDLSPAAVEAAKPGRLLAIDDPILVEKLMAAVDAGARRAEPPGGAGRFADHVIPPSAAETRDKGLSPAAYSIRVVGFFTYRRMNDWASVGVDGAVARVYDEDSSWDELLATQVLGPDGRLDVTFTWDPCFGCDGTPDLYVEFELENAEVDVHDDSIWESDYTFETGVWQDYGGTYLDVGAQTPGNAALMPACHIMTNAMRAWRFTAVNGRDTPKVDYQWPDNDGCGACYDDGLEEVYIASSREWNENTIVHEFGHHFVNAWAVITAPSYCNGLCDSGGCGHCIWCRETDHDAFNEGIADYYQDVVMRTSIPNPVTPARLYEARQMCTDSGENSYHDSWTTEGSFAALLHDMEEGLQENDVSTPQGVDELELGFDEIFGVVDQRHPLTPSDFVNWFRMDYPGLKEPFWSTAINNGYQTDSAPPGNVTNITSDHTLNQNWETRPNIRWFWSRASDDASGIQGYSIYITNNVLPVWVPDETMEVGDVTQYVSGPHPPGWYYIAIRACDRNGVWSNTYEWNGPYGIREAEPANLTVRTPSNWDYLGVTARHVPDATEYDTLAPSFLDGAGGPTYLSAIYNNSGEVATSVDQYWVSLFVDGYPQAFHHRITSLPPGVYDHVLNKPVTIGGGRHVIGVRLDDTDLMSEPSETDNMWARQWAWTPPWLGLGVPSFVTSPPGPYDGTSWIVDGSSFTANCRGFRIQDEVQNLPNTMWTAVTLHANDAADYDLSIYAPSDVPTEAFSSLWLGGSYRGAYATDVFLFNSWQFYGYPVPLDYGIVNYSGGVPGVNGFSIQKVTSQSLPFPGATSDILNTDEMLKLYQFYSPGGNVHARVKVQDPSLGRVYLTLAPQAFQYGPLLGAGTLAVSDAATGEAVINEPQTGYLCLAVWRDPNMGNEVLGVDVSIQPTPSDLAVATPAGWAAPLVPRPAADGTPGAVPAPAFLVGDVNETWVNYAIVNGSTEAVPPNPTLTASLYADGALLLTDTPPPPGPGATTYRNLPAPHEVRGGRHVLGLHVDSNDDIGEMSDANNTTAGQWVWRPSTPSFDVTVPRLQPPDRFAGWDLMPAGSPLWFNMDGLRSLPTPPEPAGDGRKVAFAALPDAGADVDIKLFEAAPDAVTGFDVELASSSWGIDQIDFLIVDFDETTPRSFDVGFVSPTVQPGASLAQFRRSTYLGAGPAAASDLRLAGASAIRPSSATTGGAHGPFTIDAGALFGLYEVDLPVGPYDIRLLPGAGSVDWGLAVYGGGEPFQTRSDALPGGTAWEAPAGSQEHLTLAITENGRHTVVVWKNRRADVDTPGTFSLEFTRETTGVPGDPAPGPGALIAGIRPNPFTGSTRVEVRLEDPAEISLQVFDVNGRPVHRRDFGPRETGPHSLDWDGTTAGGDAAPAGIYFIRVTAGTAAESRKVVRVR